MHILDAHRAAVEKANTATFSKFNKHGPYTVGSKEHVYWLEQFDQAFTKLILED